MAKPKKNQICPRCKGRGSIKKRKAQLVNGKMKSVKVREDCPRCNYVGWSGGWLR